MDYKVQSWDGMCPFCKGDLKQSNEGTIICKRDNTHEFLYHQVQDPSGKIQTGIFHDNTFYKFEPPQKKP